MVDPSQYLQQFPAAFAPLKSRFDLTSLSTLYSSVDFIGISAYPSLKPNFTTNQIESATQQFDLEIKNLGIDIKDLIFNQVSSPQAGLPFPCKICSSFLAHWPGNTPGALHLSSGLAHTASIQCLQKAAAASLEIMQENF